MAGPLAQTIEERRQTVLGLYNAIIPGGGSINASRVGTMGQGGLTALLGSARQQIDANLKPGAAPGSAPAVFGSSQPEAKGAKDRLIDLLDREMSINRLTDPKEKLGLQSAMAAAGYRVTFDNNIDDDETSQLSLFRQQLGRGLSLESIFNANAQTAQATLDATNRAAAEQQVAAQAQTDLYNKYSAGLVYAGYLKPEEMNDPKAAAIAMNTLMANTTPLTQLQSEQQRIFNGDFTNWQPSAYALEFLRNNTQGMMPRDPADPAKDRLESDLESKDPARITIAQNYLALQGANVTANGQIDRATFDAGQQRIAQPLTLPPGILDAQGKVNLEKLYGMAAHGELYLPVEKLSAEDREAAEAFPLAKDLPNGIGMPREAFIAGRLIAADPAAYQAMLAEENTRRAGATLDATVVLPEVRIETGTPILQERTVAQNYLGLEPEGLVAGTTLANQADGQTSQFGQLAFNAKDQGMQTFLTYMREHAPSGTVTMSEAMIGLEYANVNPQEAFLGGATGTGIDRGLVERFGTRLPTQLGFDGDHKFDLSNPREVQALLTGVTAYANRSSLGVGGNELISAFTSKMPDAVASIERVANNRGELSRDAAPVVQQPAVVPQDSKPATTSDRGWLTSFSEFFVGKAEAKPVVPEQQPAAATPRVQQTQPALEPTPWNAM